MELGVGLGEAEELLLGEGELPGEVLELGVFAAVLGLELGELGA